MDQDLVAQAQLRNALLRRLPDSSFEAIRHALEHVPLPVRMKLVEQGRPTHWIYFLEDGIASVISQSCRAWQEIGVFGVDGAGPFSGLLSPAYAPYTVVMQIQGHGHRIRAGTLGAAAELDPVLRNLLSVYQYSFGIQISQTAVANVQCNITERLARWILMMDDRMAQQAICITHEFLAGMLGVGRTGVTLALQELEKSKLISTGRKRIEILDRPGLEQLTTGFYGFAEREYQRLLRDPAPKKVGVPREAVLRDSVVPASA